LNSSGFHLAKASLAHINKNTPIAETINKEVKDSFNHTEINHKTSNQSLSVILIDSLDVLLIIISLIAAGSHTVLVGDAKDISVNSIQIIKIPSNIILFFIIIYQILIWFNKFIIHQADIESITQTKDQIIQFFAFLIFSSSQAENKYINQLIINTKTENTATN
jgi:hypothetical protein